jgi:hypothetical protein
MNFTLSDFMQLSQFPALLCSAIDQRRYEDVAAMVTSNGVWHRQGNQLVGPAAVLEAMQQRRTDMAIAHIVTNVIVEPTEGGATVTFHCIPFSYIGEAPKPFPLGAPGQIARWTVDCVTENGTWKATNLNSEMLFKTESQ